MSKYENGNLYNYESNNNQYIIADEFDNIIPLMNELSANGYSSRLVYTLNVELIDMIRILLFTISVIVTVVTFIFLVQATLKSNRIKMPYICLLKAIGFSDKMIIRQILWSNWKYICTSLILAIGAFLVISPQISNIIFENNVLFFPESKTFILLLCLFLFLPLVTIYIVCRKICKYPPITILKEDII